MEQRRIDHPSALVAKCASWSCSIVAGAHLAITVVPTELKHSNAVAISYAWGEFDRRDVCIGHHLGQPSQLLSLNLGQEWDVPELLQRLVELSLKHNGVWIDQLCIPQNPADIRLNLAEIPAIYSTLNVIALLSGSPPCRCFRDKVREQQTTNSNAPLSDINEVEQEIVDEDNFQIPPITWEDILIYGPLIECKNAIGLCSWLDRIWTRQEFSYSKHINILWTSVAERSCLKDKRHQPIIVDDLNPFTRLALTKALAGAGCQISQLYRPPSDEDLELVTHTGVNEMAGDFFKSGTAAVDQYTRTEDPALTFAIFLLGEPLFSGHTVEDPLYRFLVNLEELATSRRAATNPRDFVLSVWCDCPGYSIPKDYRVTSPFDLLENAIKQLEQNHSMTLITTCPSGLLSDAGLSASWRSPAPLPSRALAKARDMYSAFVAVDDAFVLPLRGGAVPLTMLSQSPGSVSRRAGAYEVVCGGYTTVQALCIMYRAINNFQHAFRTPVSSTRLSGNWEVMTKAGELFLRPKLDDSKPAAPPNFDQAFLDENADALAWDFESSLRNDVEAMTGSDGAYPGATLESIMAHEWEGRPEVDHHSIIYKIVTRVLHLDYDLCRSYGLKLTIAVNDPVCIGLTRGHLHTQTKGKRGRWVAPDTVDDATAVTGAEPHDMMTVSIYETERVIEEEIDNIPRYRVVGIWVPYIELLDGEVGAMPDADGIDAWLI